MNGSESNEVSGESPSELMDLTDDFTSGPNPEIWTLKRAEEGRMSSVVWEGKRAVRVDIHPGDKTELTSEGVKTERAELSELSSVMLPEGVEAEYGFLFNLPVDSPVNNNRLVIAQWKRTAEADRSPFASLRFINGRVRFVVDTSGEKKKFEFPEKSKEWRGGWHALRVNYKVEKGQGVVVAKIDDRSIADYEGPIGRSQEGGKIYFKMGMYRDSVNYSQSMYFADFHRAVKE